MNNTELCIRNARLVGAYEGAAEGRAAAGLQGWLARLRRWQINWRTRRQLAQLDGYQLKDIGVSRGQAQEEAAKPFWRD